MAINLLRQFQSDRSPCPDAAERVALTKLDTPGAEQNVLPSWWDAWLQSGPSRAVWLIDGVEEVIGRGVPVGLGREVIESVPPDHLRELRLVLFSRPYAELGNLRDRLRAGYESITHRTRLPHYWLTRLDRTAAADFIGADRFPAVEELIRRNDLRAVAGYPIILAFLKTYHGEAERLTVSLVWRGVLTALLGTPEAHRRLAFESTPEERFDAACRIAGVLTLSGARVDPPPQPRPRGGHGRRAFPAHPTTAGSPQQTRRVNRPCSSGRGASRLPLRPAECLETGSRHSPSPISPLPALRSALAGGDGRLSPRLREVTRLLRVTRSGGNVQELLSQLTDKVAASVGRSGTQPCRGTPRARSLGGVGHGLAVGLRVGLNQSNDLVRLRVDGLAASIAQRLRDNGEVPASQGIADDVARATDAAEPWMPRLSWRQIENRTVNSGMRRVGMVTVSRGALTGRLAVSGDEETDPSRD